MKTIWTIVPRWLPALLMMALIFLFSSQPGEELPDFLAWDYLIKKTGHAIGYGVLALAYSFLLGNGPTKACRAWALALAYAATDEYHQSFIPGRSASMTDVLLFDNLGAILGLWLQNRYLLKNKK